ncbi:MAG: HAMP domain-containing protein [Desulfobacterales bacterium]|jgi:HAMP domain-containing protein
MLVICEDCGKKYRLDPNILGRKPVKFKCKTCAHLIMLPGSQKPGGDPDVVMQRPLAAAVVNTLNESGSNLPLISNGGSETKVGSAEDREAGTSMHDTVTEVPGKSVPDDAHAIPAMLSLRSKMLFLLVFLPMIVFAFSSVLFFYQTIRLEHSLTGESAAIITRIAEAKIDHLEGLTQPVAALKARSQSTAGQIRTTIAIILGGTLLIIGATVSIFAHRLTERVRLLTDAADRISIGDLEIEIPVHSRDEFGKLAEAISRMQDSIRLSIERLRRR